MSQVAHIDDVTDMRKMMDDLALASDLQEVAEALTSDYVEKKTLKSLEFAIEEKVGRMDLDQMRFMVQSDIEKASAGITTELK